MPVRILIALGLGAAVAGCGQSISSSTGPAPVRASTPALRQVQDQGSRVLDGGVAAFKARLAKLRGRPIVVNQWASWCPPCRQEFPYLQRVAARYGDRVAFLGVDANDNRDDAKAFLSKFPTPYPHYFDPDSKIARSFRGGAAWPTTAFYSKRGALTYTHPGAYRSERDLVEDVLRYAVHG
jgi:cytochrome c biogenesis protein CcmG/thiol:disulfide interchange protein DsbE